MQLTLLDKCWKWRMVRGFYHFLPKPLLIKV